MNDHLPDNTVQARESTGGSNLLFYLFFCLSLVLPPIGVAAGLIFLTTGDDGGPERRNYRRGMILIVLGIVAFFLQMVLGSIFIFPKAMDYFSDRMAKFEYPSGYNTTVNPHNYRSGRQQPDEVVKLYRFVSGLFDGTELEQEYDNATAIIDAGSPEPMPRYVKAVILYYSEVAEDLIEDRDERFAEIERLIVEGMETDGENTEREKFLDIIMLTPYMQTQLNKENYDKANEILQQLNDMHLSGNRRNDLENMKTWAYNSWYTHWLIRDPNKALDFAFNYMREYAWAQGFTPRSFFYHYRGGLGNAFYVTRRLNRLPEYFDLLQYFLDSMPVGENFDFAEEFRIHTFTAQMLARNGQWEEAAAHFQLALNIEPDTHRYILLKANSLYNAGERLSAAELVFDYSTDNNVPERVNEIRYLCQDSPDKGLEFLLSKLKRHSDNEFIAGNIAILAHKVGRDELATAAFNLMRVIETRNLQDVAHSLADLIVKGHYDPALQPAPHINSLLIPLTAESAYVKAWIDAPSASLEERAAMLTTALELDPVEKDPDFSLFETYFDTMREMGMLEEAYEFLDEVIVSNQNRGYPRYFKATKLREDGKLQESLDAFHDLRNMMGLPGQSLRGRYPSTSFNGSEYWYNILNLLDMSHVDIRIAQISKELGDIESYKHHTFLAAIEGTGNFEAQMAYFHFELEKGNLEDAGKTLDSLSFYREVENPDGKALSQLVDGYELLEGAGWVRERNFTPILP